MNIAILCVHFCSGDISIQLVLAVNIDEYYAVLTDLVSRSASNSNSIDAVSSAAKINDDVAEGGLFSYPVWTVPPFNPVRHSCYKHHLINNDIICFSFNANDVFVAGNVNYNISLLPCATV